MEVRRQPAPISRPMKVDNFPYPVVAWPYRAAFYAICSFYFEVVYTAIYQFVETGNVKMRGYSSIWSLFIYGALLTSVEQIYFALRRRGFAFPIRGLAYMCSTFLVELLAGFVLQPFNANSWDYSKQFTYHYRGLITLEYAPLWFVTGLLFEYKVDLCSRLILKPSSGESRREVHGRSTH